MRTKTAKRTTAKPASKAPPSASSSKVQRKAWWRYFATRKFLFYSIGFHVLLALVAAVWIVQVTYFKRDKQNFVAQQQEGPKGPMHALEHKVSMAKKQSSMSAPPPLKRVMTLAPSKVSLPPVPALPRTQSITPMAMTGMGGSIAPGAGFGSGAGGGGLGGGGGNGGQITSFIGGLRVTAQRLGVALDISGSVAEYQQEMHDYVAKTFSKNGEISEFSAAGFFSVKSARGSLGMSVLEFLNSPKKFDAIYIFSDFGETYEKARREGQEDLWPQVQKLMREKKVRLYIHILPFKSGRLQDSPEMASVIQLAKSSGGGVKTGDMPHASLKSGGTTASSAQ